MPDNILTRRDGDAEYPIDKPQQCDRSFGATRKANQEV